MKDVVLTAPPHADAAPIVRAQTALLHIIRRLQVDAEFRYHMMDTESLDRVVDAYAAITGQSIGDVMGAIRASRPSCDARCAIDRDRVHDLERKLEERGAS